MKGPESLAGQGRGWPVMGDKMEPPWGSMQRWVLPVWAPTPLSHIMQTPSIQVLSGRDPERGQHLPEATQSVRDPLWPLGAGS